MSTPERFWAKVDKRSPTECWEWKAAKINGYGVFGTGWKKPRVRAHRKSWELERGPIPVGLCVLHRCDNRPCVNPDHLWLGTKKDNTQDALRKGRMKLNTHANLYAGRKNKRHAV